MGWMGFEHRARFDELLILPWSVSEFQEVDKRRDASDSADTAINSRLGCNPKPPRKLSGNRVKRCHTPPPPPSIVKVQLPCQAPHGHNGPTR